MILLIHHYSLGNKIILFTVLMVNFNPTTYSVIEGNRAKLNIFLNAPSDRDVTIKFATNDGTATGF